MQTEDGYIIHQCLNGDRDAFGLLVDKYRAGVFALIYSKLRNFHDSQDVTQEVFIKAYAKLHTLRQWDRFAGWLYRIASRRCRDWIRDHSKRPDREFIEDNSEIDNIHSLKSYRDDILPRSVHDALDSLPEIHRQVLILTYFSGMTSSEIADFVGISAAGVRKRLIMAREALKEEVLRTMQRVFDEQKLQASFTLVITEMIKHVRIQPISDKLVPWGLSISAGIIFVLLGIGASRNLLYPLYNSGSEAMPVDIVDEAIMESGGDKMLKDKFSAVIAAVAVLSVLSGSAMAGDAPGVEWERTFGGTRFDIFYSVAPTNDGGYILTGSTNSMGAGNDDIYIVKTDTYGNTQWYDTFGESEEDYARLAQQTSDDGYIIIGNIRLPGRESDIYLIKTDAEGNREWDRTFGGTHGDYGYSVYQTPDDGYVLACVINSDIHLIKTDLYGNMQWDRTFGGSGDDDCDYMEPTNDGGYILAGFTYSYGAGYSDVYLIKTTADGTKEWEQVIGGPGRDRAFEVHQTTDGGYIVAGGTESYGAGSRDFYVIKLDANGNETWYKTYGGSGTDQATSVQQTEDGGYIIVGGTESFGAGGEDIYIVKADAMGNIEWEKTLGEETNDKGWSVLQIADGGYIIAGQKGYAGSGVDTGDAYLVKLEPEVQPGGITVELRDSLGNLITNSGAIIKYQPNSSGPYIDFGDGFINVNGTETADIEPGRHRFRLTYQACTQEKQQDVRTDPVVTYQTHLVTVELKDSTGAYILNSNAIITWQPGSAGSYVSFGGGALDDDNGTASMEVLPLRHRFRLTYQNCTQEKQNSEDIVTYQTHLVTVELKDSFNACILNSGATITWQPGSAGSYVSFGGGALDDDSGKASMEVLPLRHRFRLTYQDCTQEKQSNADTVTYQTHLVTLELRDSGDNLVENSGALIIWQSGSAGSYVNFGDDGILNPNGQESMEVLPLSHRFRMTYSGGNKELQSNNAVVTFHTSSFPCGENCLYTNFPNPFNPETWIPYDLKKDADVTICIYNTSGHLVRTLTLGYQDTGSYVSRSRAAYWDGRNEAGEPVASGVYFYFIQAGEFTAMKKMVVAK